MKILTTQEKEMVRSIIKLTEGGRSIKIEDFLKDSYFKEKFGRALIIQTGGKYSVLFLKKEQYDDPAQRATGIADFLGVITFINHLVDEGHITVYKNTPNNMYYIQDGFNSPKVVNNTLIFNTKGDYSSSPDTIFNSKNEEIYKGILYRGEQHNYIAQLACGSLIASPTLAQMLVEPAPPQPSPTPEPKKIEPIPQPTPAPTPPVDPMQPLNPLQNQQHSIHSWQHQQEFTPHPPAKPKKKRKWEKHVPFIWALSILNLLLVGGAAYLLSNQGKQFQTYEAKILSIDSSYHTLKDTVSYHKRLIASIAKRKPVEKPKPIEPIEEEEREGTYYGIDISHHNGTAVSYLTNHDSVSFIITKATQGTHFLDPYLGTNWKLVKDKGLILGVYHFYETHKDPVRQADFFWKAISKHGTPDITPILDIETASFPKNKQPNLDKLHKNLIIFLDELEKKSGRVPMIYTNYLFANKYLYSRKFQRYPLWLAEYTSRRRPKLPKTWRKEGFKIWQKQDNYKVHHHDTDFDVYYGKLSELTD